ncbi:MAG: Protein YeeZ [Chlamydiae bacterium]|nr:Protein YeeZ [Chlamydiota bacterium]
MNIFILGCGFVGSKIAELFFKQGHTVTVTTTSESKIQALEQIASQVLLVDSQTDLSLVLRHQDVLIITVAPKTKDDYEEAYLKTAELVLKALSQECHIKQLIYTSSCSVYGEKQGQWVDENHPLEPTNRSQQILCDTESIYLNKLPTSVKVCLFRLGEIYGLDKAIEFKIKNMTLLNYKPHGDNFTNLIHVEDIVRAVNWSLQNKSSGVFNLCNDSHLTRREFYDAWCQFLNLKPLEFRASKGGAHRGNKKVNNHKIKLMGFEFEHPVCEPTN